MLCVALQPTLFQTLSLSMKSSKGTDVTSMWVQVGPGEGEGRREPKVLLEGYGNDQTDEAGRESPSKARWCWLM